MKLLRLVLQGFKSFADKTTVDFSEGMTVIVGPNGCGKSNISDAVRWVLGESNVRNLRGQKAEDIIFSGAEGRPAKHGAEVTLVLDNSLHELPLDTTEVSITRRILRNGDSDFQINKRNCRLKDIQELLANTGLGKGSLAIIGQNRVDQVLTAKPDERRLIFEDVAGIGLYRMRKTEGLRKLEKTAENMERVKDMMALLEEQLEPLKEGAEKAKAYKGLMSEKRAVEATLHLLKLASLKKWLQKAQSEYEELEKAAVEQETKLSVFSVEREKLETELLTHRDKLQEAGALSEAAQQKMEELRGDYRVKEEARRHQEEKRNEFAEREEDQKEAEEELKEEIETAKQELALALQEKEEKEILLKQKEEEKEKISKDLEAAEEEYVQALETSRKELIEKERNEQELSHTKEEMTRLSSEIKTLAAETDELLADVERTKEESGRIEREEKEKSNLLKTLEEEGKVLSISHKEAEDTKFALQMKRSKGEQELSAIHSKREYLEHAEKEYTGFSMASKMIMQNKDRFGEAVHGLLGELIRVPEKYTDAAEIALGARISHIVVDTSESAQQMIQWLKQKNLGRTTFYPLDSMKGSSYEGAEREAAKEQGICGIASELFACHKDYQNLVDSLLGKTLIADTLDDARRVSKKYHYRLRIVTLDGQLVNAGGSLTGGSMKKSENTFFGRKKEIKELLAKEESLRKELEEEKKRLISQREKCEELATLVTQKREEWQKSKEEIAALVGRKEGISRALSDKNLQLAQGQEKLLSLQNKLSAEQEKEKVLSEKVAAQKEIKEGADNRKTVALKVELEKKNQELLDIHVALSKAQESVTFGKRMEEERNRAKEELEKARRELEQEKIDNQKLLETLDVEMADLRKAFIEAGKEVQARKKVQEELQNASNSFAISQRNNENAWRKAQEKASSLRRDLAERKGKIENYTAQEEEEIRVMKEKDLSLFEAERIKLEGSLAEIKAKEEKISKALAALGAVNPNGEEEYQKQLDRKTFFETQLEDLKQAKDGLETVVASIDQTMEQEFGTAFQAINEEFSRIMQIMFRGGQAKLELTDEEHPLDGGVEMYLQLPGKKRQPLSLMSGGERALTVIALLMSFMAYRPAPFCFVDEIDAALDDANVERYSDMIGEYKKKTQFIVISHRKKTMEFADTLQGVTMAEKGVSSLVTVKMKDYVEA